MFKYLTVAKITVQLFQLIKTHLLLLKFLTILLLLVSFDHPHNRVAAENVQFYLPFSHEEGGVRISRTGLLYRPNYDAAGLQTIQHNPGVGIFCDQGHYCLGPDGEYHDYNDNFAFVRGAIDFQLDYGDKVLATTAGTVVSELTSMANCQIVIDHGNGIRSYYLHLSAIHVYSGQVERGQHIGDVGHGCGANGAHLHFALWSNGSEIKAVFADESVQAHMGIVRPSRTGYVEYRYQADQPGLITSDTRIFSDGTSTGDFNGDGYIDLAVGVPGEAVANENDAGAVNVLYGSSGGISAGNDQLWKQGTGGLHNTPEADDWFGAALASGDFNNDGYDDLAIGVPGEDLSEGASAGAIHILYGSSSGLSSSAGPGTQWWKQGYHGLHNTPEAGDLFGAALASGDFNDDGYDDLNIGVPNEDLTEGNDAGAVHTIYGSSSGLSANSGPGTQWWKQGYQGLHNTREGDDLFGAALDVNDFNGDGYDDLVIGVPGEDLTEGNDAGAAHAVYGSSSGLSANGGPGTQWWKQGYHGLHNVPETGDLFGAELGSGDFNNDGYGDLVIGVPKEELSGVNSAGAVHVVYGSSNGLSSNGGPGTQWWKQGYHGLHNAPEEGDWFGGALSGGDFNNDGYDDLVIAVPGEDLEDGSNQDIDAGAAHVLYGSSGGLSSGSGPGTQWWKQGYNNIQNSPENDEFFGASLTNGDFNGDGYEELVIGVPGEGVDTTADAGVIHVLYGSVNGAQPHQSYRQVWYQDSPDVEGSVEAGDRFGGAILIDYQ